MKVIDLLNKIANGEKLPPKIKYDGKIWIAGKKEYHDEITDNDLFIVIFRHNLTHSINDEVEILKEDKKIEKLKGEDKGIYIDYSKANIVDKINELIDEINKLKEG